MVERVNDYHEGNRHFQDRFDTRRLADQIASRTRDHIDEPARTLIEHAEAITRDNNRITLTMALSYGGRAEIIAAVRAIAQQVTSGNLAAETIDDERFARHLFTAELPDPDLLIRTSGEQRLSNFLLWQAAYAELVFTKTLWPDFSKGDLQQAIDEFCGRERRYGASVGSL